MSTEITVGTKYQIVIPKEVRKQIKGIKPGAKVIVSSSDKNTITINSYPDSANWAKRTAGLMRDAWKKSDPIKELEKSRNEW